MNKHPSFSVVQYESPDVFYFNYLANIYKIVKLLYIGNIETRK